MIIWGTSPAEDRLSGVNRAKRRAQLTRQLNRRSADVTTWGTIAGLLVILNALAVLAIVWSNCR